MARAARREIKKEIAAALSAAAKMARLKRAFEGDGEPLWRPLKTRRTSYVASPSRLAMTHWSAPTVYSPRFYFKGADGRRSFHCKVTYIPKTMRQRTLSDGTRIAPGAAQASAKYKAGANRDDRQGYLMGERVQQTEDGKTYFESNISHDSLGDIFAFFDLVEQCERTPSNDKVAVDFHHDPVLWRNVANDPDCEPAVRQAWAARNVARGGKIELTRGGDHLFRIMRKHGFKPASHFDPQGKKRTAKQRAKLDGINWIYGRGGVTQIRVIHALPHEFNAAQRIETVKVICARLDKLGVMYFAVIHEPEADNDARNFHVHIDIYDRPCRRLDGTENDLATVNPKIVGDIRKALRKGDFKDQVGQWDFAVTREYRSSSGNLLKHRPFRQNKQRDAHKVGLAKRVRQWVETDVNAVANRHGLKAIYDCRTYKEMGVAKVPDVTLGPREHALVKRGIPTRKSTINENRHAAAHMRLVHQKYLRELQNVDDLEAQLMSILTAADPSGKATKTKVKETKKELDRLRAYANAERERALLELTIERSMSTCYAVGDRADRLVESGADRDGEFRDRHRHAEAWLGGGGASYPAITSAYLQLMSELTTRSAARKRLVERVEDLHSAAVSDAVESLPTAERDSAPAGLPISPRRLEPAQLSSKKSSAETPHWPSVEQENDRTMGLADANLGSGKTIERIMDASASISRPHERIDGKLNDRMLPAGATTVSESPRVQHVAAEPSAKSPKICPLGVDASADTGAAEPVPARVVKTVTTKPANTPSAALVAEPPPASEGHSAIRTEVTSTPHQPTAGYDFPLNRFGQAPWKVEEVIKRWNGDDLRSTASWDAPVGATTGPVSRHIVNSRWALQRTPSGVIFAKPDEVPLAFREWIKANPAIGVNLFNERQERIMRRYRERIASGQKEQGVARANPGKGLIDRVAGQTSNKVRRPPSDDGLGF